MNRDQLHRLGMAAANLEAAIEKEAPVFREHRPEDHAAVVGDALVLALALKGFVVVDDPEAAAATIRGLDREVLVQ